jgi:dTDP-4-dehydrorhamnose reductase
MNTSRRLLVTGASGFLGSCILRLAERENWEVCGTYLSRCPEGATQARLHRLDIRDEISVRKLVREFRPDTVIHTAYSQNDRSVTFGGTLALSGACRSLERPPHFIHVSTDLVFDGVRGMYREEDEARPLIDYGKDKLDAELAVRENLPGALIIRSAILYDLRRVPSHLGFALSASGRGETFTFFSDEFRSPVLVEELSKAILDLAERGASGTLHIAGADRVNRWWFGVRLMRVLGLSSELARPGSFREKGLVRPADCSLDVSRAEAFLGMRFRGVREVFAGCGINLEE